MSATGVSPALDLEHQLEQCFLYARKHTPSTCPHLSLLVNGLWLPNSNSSLSLSPSPLPYSWNPVYGLSDTYHFCHIFGLRNINNLESYLQGFSNFTLVQVS